MMEVGCNDKESEVMSASDSDDNNYVDKKLAATEMLLQNCDKEEEEYEIYEMWKINAENDIMCLYMFCPDEISYQEKVSEEEAEMADGEKVSIHRNLIKILKLGTNSKVAINV